MKKLKRLSIFDMDYTISQSNLQLSFFKRMKFSQKKQIFQDKHTTWEYIIKKAISSNKFTMKAIDDLLYQIRIVYGMKSLLQFLKNHDYQIIIISGGNNLLIKRYLEIYDCDTYIDKILSNQLRYDKQQQKLYYINDMKGICQLPTCKQNFCKNYFLNQFYINFKDYQQVFIIGDGINDLCLMNKIQKGTAFIRKQFGLDKKLQSNEDLQKQIRCEAFYWQNGYDIIEYLKQYK